MIKNIMRIMFALFFWIAGCSSDNKKHIILFIGDGMHLEHETAGSRYLTGKDNNLVFHSFDYQNSCSTWDVSTYNLYASSLGAAPYDINSFKPSVGYNPSLGGDKPYPRVADLQESYFLGLINGKVPATDSASAATAISTGLKTDDGNIAWKSGDPADGALVSISQRLKKELGYSIAVVSTVPFSHATPASFVSHNTNRNNYLNIASEIIRVTKPDVVIGGGHPGWTGKYNFIGKPEYNYLKTGSEYIFCERRAGAKGSLSLSAAQKRAISEKKLLFGLYGGLKGNFEYPVPSNSQGSPSFTINTENPTLADMVSSTLNVLSRNKNGFFVMFEQGDIDWANHANDYRWMIGSIYDLNTAVQTAVNFVNRPGDEFDWNNTLIIVTSDHSNSFMRLNAAKKPGKGVLPRQIALPGKFLYPDGEVSYTTIGHTNELVSIYAKGKDARRFQKFEGKWYPGTRIIDNTNIYQIIAEITGLK
jgi:alkaline phosphatase